MNCINKIIALFQGETMCAAVGLAVVAFVIGALAMCILCRLCRPCGRGACADARKSSPSRAKFEGRSTPVPEKRHPAPADGSIEIYVGNLSYEMTDDQLRKEFEAFGKVNSARVITNRYNGKSKGFGFVHMPNRDEVNAAVKALSDKDILGRRIRCNVAQN